MLGVQCPPAEKQEKHFNGFLDIMYMDGKIIISILSRLLREFLDTYNSGWNPLVFVSGEGDKEVK